MNTGMKRMLKYMAVYAQRLCLYYIIFVAAWTVYMLVLTGGLGGTGISLETILTGIPTTFIYLGVLMELIFTTAYLPLLSNGHLSMGATRREFSLGIIFAHALSSLEIAVVGTVLQAIVVALYGGFGVGKYFCVALCVFFFACGIGFLMGLLIEKFGKVAYYIFVGIMALCGGVIGGLSTAMNFMDIYYLLSSNFLYFSPLIGIALFAICAGVYRLVIAKKVVTV